MATMYQQPPPTTTTIPQQSTAAATAAPLTTAAAVTTTDIETLERELEKNPDDFNKWETYVTRREQEQNIDNIRQAYEKLLKEYPLLYGYWKKYADLEAANRASFQTVTNIYERGVKAIPQSVDLWAHYCVYVAEVSQDLNEIRSLFERAVQAIGDDYLAQTLWDKYIEFEVSQEEHANVFSLYTRILYIPLKVLGQYWEQCKKFAASKSSNEILSPNELAQYASITDEEQRQREIIMSRERIFDQTNTELARRNVFEQGIERPYFHVQPLGPNELNTWRQYLENEEDKCDEDRVVKLYERCLVACALYLEFWKRYAFYLESKNRIEDARNALSRAANIFLKSRPTSHITLAEFEEQQGNVEQASQIFKNVANGVGKGHVETIVRFAHFYRRQNMHNEATALFTEHRDNVQSSESKAFLDVQHANYVGNILNDVNGARQIFTQCINDHPGSRFAWLAYIEFETKHLSGPDAFTSTFQPIFAKISALTEDEISNSDKAAVMDKYYSHMIHYAPTVHDIRLVEQTILKLKTIVQKTKKRKAESSASDGPSKVAKTDAAATPSAAAYQWYGYNPQQYYAYYQQYQQQQGAAPPQPDGASMYQQPPQPSDPFGQYLAANRQQ